jgi:hypothetical protein
MAGPVRHLPLLHLLLPCPLRHPRLRRRPPARRRHRHRRPPRPRQLLHPGPRPHHRRRHPRPGPAPRQPARRSRRRPRPDKEQAAAIDRYFTAVENGTMDDTTAGPRITALQAEIDQLQARHHEITDTIGDEPAALPPHHPAARHLPARHPRRRHSRRAQSRRRRPHRRDTHHQGRNHPRVQNPRTTQPHPRRNHHNQHQRGPGSRNGSIGGPARTRTSSRRRAPRPSQLGTAQPDQERSPRAAPRLVIR